MFAGSSAPLSLTEFGTPKTVTSAFEVEAGDFDGDGISDVVVTNASDPQVSFLRGTGTDLADPEVATAAAPTHRVAVGDINGDGVDDVVVTHFNLASAEVFLSNP